VNAPPKCATATAALESNGAAGEDVHETPVADLIGVDSDGAGLDELHRRPALELAIAEPVRRTRIVMLMVPA
jgi:hypothetical protein